MKLTGLILLLSLNATVVQSAYATDHVITVGQAKKLVILALSKEQRQLPKLGTESDDNRSRFWYFTVTWQGVPHGSVVVGSYAVDSLTGDVFSGAASCSEINDEALRAFQLQLRSKLHLAKTDYLRLKTDGPLC